MRASSALVLGVVAAAVGVGVGLLVRALVPGAQPFWSTTVLVAGTVLSLLVGALAGLLSRTRRSAGAAVLLLGGVVAVVVVASTAADVLAVVVPVVATVAATVTFLLCAPGGRSVPTPATDGVAMPRRRALVLGGALAVVTAAAGVFVSRTGPGAPGGAVGAGGGPHRSGATGPDGATGGPLRRGTVVDVRSLGAIGDGRADDSAALVRGLQMASTERGTLFLPAGTYRCAGPTTLRPGSGVTLAGEPGRSVIEFAGGTAGGSGSCVVVEASDVTIDGIELRRAAAVDTVLLSTGEFRRLTVSRSVLNGAMDRFPDNYCHGIKIGDSGEGSDLQLADCTVTTVQYGLFQTNDSTAVTTNVRVERCLFTGNRNTDLEFNSPRGATRQVTVRACRFENNDSPGFGVGFARVDGATVSANTFRNYAMEAVHVEDYSSGIVVESNDLAACGLRENSFVQVISGAQGVVVRANTFDASTNAEEIHVVTSQPGGNGTTVSGRPVLPPTGTVVQDNYVVCAPAVTPIYFEGATGSAVVGNTFVGTALGASDTVLQMLQSPDTTIRGNTVNGSPL